MTPVQIHLAALLWISGHDTSDIADRLGIYPASVYNALDAIKGEAALLRGVAA